MGEAKKSVVLLALYILELLLLLVYLIGAPSSNNFENVAYVCNRYLIIRNVYPDKSPSSLCILPDAE